MSNIVYLNGHYLPLEEARISPLDRGFLFGDSVYEVIPVRNHQPVTAFEHVMRLNHSLAAINLPPPLSDAAWGEIFETLLARPFAGDRMLYVHVTRGSYAERRHASPSPEQVVPTVFVAALPVLPKDITAGIQVITVKDDRWAHCRIKATTLLPNVLAKDAAQQQQATDAIFMRDGFALEATASNLFIVKEGVVMTPPLSANILPGVTRALVITLLQRHQITVIETMITLAALQQADEIWLTGSISEITAVVRVDNVVVGGGRVGPLYQQALAWYRERSPLTECA